MGGPLEGIRVLELAIWQTAPVAGRMLGQMGAEVIKVEDPSVGGDPGRGVLRLFGAVARTAATGRNYYFESHNRDKKSIAINLNTPQGREVVYRLASRADVFISNFLPQTLHRLKMDSQTLAQVNPRLIYALVSSFGTRGPDRDKTAYDIIAQARSGLMFAVGEPDGPPTQVGIGVADELGGIMLAYGVALALVARERQGIVQEVNASLLGGVVSLYSLLLHSYLYSGQLPQRGRSDNPLWNIYRAQDERWLCLGMVQTDRYWSGLCRATGLEGLEHDPRFDTHVKRSIDNGPLLRSILDEHFATQPASHWVERLEANGQVFTLVNTFAELAEDPQMAPNEFLTELEYPEGEKVRVVGPPVQLSQTPGKVRSPAPELGQHTEEVLLEIGGYTWEEIAQLKIDGAIP